MDGRQVHRLMTAWWQLLQSHDVRVGDAVEYRILNG